MSKSKEVWPKTLRILTGKDIVKNHYSYQGRHCLMGWGDDQFMGKSRAVKYIFMHTLRDNLVRLGSRVDGNEEIEAHNDRGGLKNDQLAKAWNMTLADFGYVEIDESEWKDYE